MQKRDDTRKQYKFTTAKSQQISPKQRQRETWVSESFPKNHKMSVHRNLNFP